MYWKTTLNDWKEGRKEGRKESSTKRDAIELIIVETSAKIGQLRMMSVRVRPQSFEELLELQHNATQRNPTQSERGREERGERREKEEKVSELLQKLQINM